MTDLFIFHCFGCGARTGLDLRAWQNQGFPVCCGERMARIKESSEVMEHLLQRELEAMLAASEGGGP